MYFVYIIKNYVNQIYIGITQDLNQRLRYHNTRQGAQFTKGGNYKIVFQETYLTLSKARRREIQVKKWRRDKKELLVERFNQGLPTKI